MPHLGKLEGEGAVRLVGGPSEREGRLEIYHDGVWGTVCDDKWSNVDANVVCTQLGFHNTTGKTTWSAQGKKPSMLYGVGTGPVWLDEVQCSGAEDALASCPSRGWGKHNCVHSDDAGMQCEAPSQPLAASLPFRSPHHAEAEAQHVQSTPEPHTTPEVTPSSGESSTPA